MCNIVINEEAGLFFAESSSNFCIFHVDQVAHN